MASEATLKASKRSPVAPQEQGEMEEPFDRVATNLNRDLAWIAGGIAAIGGAVVMAGFVAVDVLVRHHRGTGKTHHRH
jgi:hypothetical protein